MTAAVHDMTVELSMIPPLEPVRFKDNEFSKDLPDEYIYYVRECGISHAERELLAGENFEKF